MTKITTDSPGEYLHPGFCSGFIVEGEALLRQSVLCNDKEFQLLMCSLLCNKLQLKVRKCLFWPEASRQGEHFDAKWTKIIAGNLRVKCWDVTGPSKCRPPRRGTCLNHCKSLEKWSTVATPVPPLLRGVNQRLNTPFRCGQPQTTILTGNQLLNSVNAAAPEALKGFAQTASFLTGKTHANFHGLLNKEHQLLWRCNVPPLLSNTSQSEIEHSSHSVDNCEQQSSPAINCWIQSASCTWSSQSCCSNCLPSSQAGLLPIFTIHSTVNSNSSDDNAAKC